MSEVATLEKRAYMAPVTLLHAGQRTHTTVDAAMQALQAQRIAGEIPDTLIFVEHPEVITVGRRAKIDGITAPEGYASREVDRGGGITWPGPGQLVGYPVFRWREESIRTVITLIEEWILRALATFGVAAGRNPAMMGVWLDSFKIASIGLQFSQWVSRHGFDINLSTPGNRLQAVAGCGLPVGRHTSLAALGHDISIRAMEAALLAQMPAVLGREMAAERDWDF
ncbi:MAG: lipoyl(octanoyl) transferase LipB [Candidatus Poseidoniia archaeon]|nr:lipoyl(octanoyl) transferase LipB [Candidatus Poseidoniia archaeon]